MKAKISLNRISKIAFVQNKQSGRKYSDFFDNIILKNIS